MFHMEISQCVPMHGLVYTHMGEYIHTEHSLLCKLRGPEAISAPPVPTSTPDTQILASNSILQ